MKFVSVVVVVVGVGVSVEVVALQGILDNLRDQHHHCGHYRCHCHSHQNKTIFCSHHQNDHNFRLHPKCDPLSEFCTDHHRRRRLPISHPILQSLLRPAMENLPIFLHL